jgi:uncharacterized protein (UPF0212 family)
LHKEEVKHVAYVEKSKVGTIACPNCNHHMEGFSMVAHYYECPNCRTEVKALGVTATSEFGWIIGLLGVFSVLALIGAALANE